jgi:hypothetical protein
MATFSPTDGVDESEPTLISDGSLQDTDGAEYRVGEIGLFVARGRNEIGDIGSATGRGLYEAGFDGSTGHIVAHEGNSLHASLISNNLSFSLIDNLPQGSSQIVGSHYASRHYMANSASTFTIGVSVTQGSGSMSASTGLEYWVTEYDSVRGVETVMGSTANTGVFTNLDSVLVTVTGASASLNSDKIRWYRSTDGGGYPDGSLIQTTPIGTTQITDGDVATSTLGVPQYGIISIGGLDSDRDEAPPIFSTIFGPYQDSLLAVSVDEPRVLRFTPAGYPDSWPSGYGIPIETARNDVLVTGVVLHQMIGVFAKDSVHVVYRLPRDADSIFAAGEAQDVLTDERGCVSRRGATTFTIPGQGRLAAWVSRDGIWGSNLTGAPAPMTDRIDWEGRVSIPDLTNCRLMNDPLNRRLIFLHRKKSDVTHNTGLWYIDYQRFPEVGMRITFADHGPLADAVLIDAPDDLRRVCSIDSRESNGQVYLESVQDVDDSQLRDSDGSVRFRARTKEFLPAGARGATHLGKATWMHDAGPARIEHRFYHNRRDDNPEIKDLSEPTKRTASDASLQRNVNSVSMEISSAGTKSYGVHWVDVEGFNAGRLGGRKGA